MQDARIDTIQEGYVFTHQLNNPSSDPPALESWMHSSVVLASFLHRFSSKSGAQFPQLPIPFERRRAYFYQTAIRKRKFLSEGYHVEIQSDSFRVNFPNRSYQANVSRR